MRARARLLRADPANGRHGGTVPYFDFAELFPIQSIDIHRGNRAGKGRIPNRSEMAELLGPGRSHPNGMRTEVAITRALAVLAVLGIVAALYFARAIFLPLAL